MKQYRDFLCADSFEEAMEAYVRSLGGPPQWNTWQVAAWKLAPYYDEDFAAHSTATEKQRYIAKLYKELLTRIFGERWRHARPVMPAVELFESFAASQESQA